MTPRAYVDLPSGLDETAWRARWERGEVPDASPYGLHHLTDHGVDVVYRRPHRSPVLERVARSVRYRSDGYEIAEAVADSRARRRADADVVLGYDERTSVPAALLAAARLSPPVIAGIGWLTTRAAAAPAHGRLAAAALPRAAIVWAQCAPMLPLLQREWGVPADRLRFVPFGIDTDFYGEQPWPDEPGTGGGVASVVVGAGEDRFRDHQLLVDAMTDVRDRRPGTRLELATALPVRLPRDSASWVTMHTERLDGRMRDLYRRATVVAVALRPSMTGSGLSVILEAMASGRPVVASANPGLDDYVEDGVTGVLVPVGDRAALADAVAGLLADPQRAAELGRNGAARVRERFTSDAMAAALAVLIREQAG